jgi:hypothetical protein
VKRNDTHEGQSQPVALADDPFAAANEIYLFNMTSSSRRERRIGVERRTESDRRNGWDRRREAERAVARRLPDEFAQAGGDAADRITSLVSRHWMNHDSNSRMELAAALLPILESLLEPGTPVTDEHRNQCEEKVIAWVTAGTR